MTCSARSFSLSRSDSISAASRSGEAPRGRVPAMGRVETIPPCTDTSRSGEELITAKSPSRRSAANGLGLAARKRPVERRRIDRRRAIAHASRATDSPGTHRRQRCTRARGARPQKPSRILLLDLESDHPPVRQAERTRARPRRSARAGDRSPAPPRATPAALAVADPGGGRADRERRRWGPCSAASAGDGSISRGELVARGTPASRR